MRTISLLVLCILNMTFLFAQKKIPIIENDTRVKNKEQEEGFVKLNGKTMPEDYKIISYTNDTTFVDTTLTIQKYYTFNFTRKDNFAKVPFANLGQTFNSLYYDFSNISPFPGYAAKAKLYDYKDVKDIKYYYVPTPTSELAYRTAMTQGNFLDAFLTFNTSERLNLSFGYKGLRSLGHYRHALSSHGSFNTTFNYISKKERYFIKGHYTSQDLLNDENGGITPESLEAFLTGDRDFRKRNRLDVYFTDADNLYIGKRYYFSHQYHFITGENTLALEHIYKWESLKYKFSQSKEDKYFGPSYTRSIYDKSHFKTLENNILLSLKSKWLLGKLSVGGTYLENAYYFYHVKHLEQGIIPARIDQNAIVGIANWNVEILNFRLSANAQQILGGAIRTGHKYRASAYFASEKKIDLEIALENISKKPNYNYILNHSNYTYYNWYNPRFKNEKITTLSGYIKTKWFELKATHSQIQNYTFFDQRKTTPSNSAYNIDHTNNEFINNDEFLYDVVELVIPRQHTNTIKYLKVKLNNTLRVGKFSLDNSILYQNVIHSGDNVINVPKFTTRNSLYITSFAFKKALYFQTGITFNYFTEFYMNNYNPLLSEFTLQNETKIGGYSILDLFINTEIQRTRIFFKLENFTSLLTKTPSYLSAPNTPYRDMIFRAGLVWNFFI